MPCASSSLRSGTSAPRSRCQRTTASLSVRFQRRNRQLRVGGKLRVPETLGDLHVVGMAHPGHALAHRAQVLDVRVDERGGVERRVLAQTEPCRDHELGMRLHHVVHLDERLDAELPVHGEPARVPPLGPQRLDLPRVEHRGGWIEGLAERRGTVVEVDPRATAPLLAPHRDEIEVVGIEVVLGERPPLGDRGVLAVGPVAPAVERAPEPRLAGPATLDDLDAAVATGVLERAHPEVVGAHHDDRLVEDLVLDEVARLGDLLEPAGHLPDPGPELLGLQGGEAGIDVALLGHAVRVLDREGHRQRRPLLAPPSPRSVD